MKLHVWSVIPIFGVTLVSLSYSPAFPFVFPQSFVRGDHGTNIGIESSRLVLSCWYNLGEANSRHWICFLICKVGKIPSTSAGFLDDSIMSWLLAARSSHRMIIHANFLPFPRVELMSLYSSWFGSIWTLDSTEGTFAALALSLP